MKTIEEFNAFVAQQLDAQLQQLENQRQSAQAWVRRMRILGVVPVILFFAFLMWVVIPRQENNNPNSLSIFLFLGIGVVLTLALSFGLRRYMANQKGMQEMVDYKQDFKNKVIQPIIRFIDPAFSYQPLNHASYEEFMESGLFTRQEYNISGNDQVFGKTGDLSFQWCDLKVTHMPVVTLRGMGHDVIFEGTWFIAQFPRYFTTPVYIVPRSTMMEKLTTSDTDYIETWNLGKKVTTADTAFNKLFMAYAKDTDEAQQLLTAPLLAKIVRLQERSQAPVYMSFSNNRIYIGISHGEDYFEAGLQESLTDRRLLTDFYLDFTGLMEIVDDLRQNGSIWTSVAFSRT
ncbi:DUF3137 domain-containing protein [Chitinophaga qingshengii]|uniref:DUF3137 domain-containing protein n=1 Tax=Chitinophaga qingshengii TaxID=1569794 RepID=A0ABR7TJP3_9BACT|nr:DUF3137 domain-containing protein [Chitinophaga qingshengii]MBC9930210.1 DUF3137 domain-containing protein [Chitinophaga qingshengii]